MKILNELINESEPGWDLLRQWLAEAKNPYEILPREQKRAEEELLGLQVSTRSPMGAIVYGCDGILIDHGWLRILGSGCERLNRGIFSFNIGKSFTAAGERPSYLLVADDVLGGFFAINGGAFAGEAGNVFYYAPDSGEWEDCEMGYSQFVYWALCGDTLKFYELFRWEGWCEDIVSFSPDRTMFALPPLLWQDADIKHKLAQARTDA